MPRGRGGHNAGRGMTYDFGVAIASRTINSMNLMTGYALSLTTAIYGLSKVTGEYTDMIKHNQLAFGGTLKTMKAMQWAQNQLLSGATEFATGDILSGMKQLASAGVDAAGKFKWLSSAAEATGESFSQFAGTVSGAINGSMSGLVQMGVMTQRVADKFDRRYIAGTNSRKNAIMSFLQQHKGLNQAIANSFSTITGKWRGVMAGIRMFALAIMGNPNDPNSLYQQIVKLIGGIVRWIDKHKVTIQKFGSAIGMVMGWVVRQLGKFLRFVGNQFSKVLNYFEAHMGNFTDKMHSLLLWLELWKVHITKFLHDHKKEIYAVIIAYVALKAIEGGVKAIGSVAAAFDIATIAARKFRKQGLFAGSKFTIYNSADGRRGVRSITSFWDKIRGVERKTMAQLAKERGLDVLSRRAYISKMRELANGMSPSELRSNLPGMRQQAKEAAEAVREAFFKNITKQDLISKGKGLLGKAKDLIPTQALKKVGNGLVSFVRNPMASIRTVGAGIATLFTDQGIIGGVASLGGGFLRVFSVVSRLFGVVTKFIGPIGWIITAVLLIWKYWDKIYPVVYNIFATLWNMAVVVGKKLWGAIKWVGNGFVKLWDYSKKIAHAMYEWMPDFLKSSITWVIDKVSWLWDKIKGIGSYLSGVFSKAADKTKTMAGPYGIGSYESTHPVVPPGIPVPGVPTTSNDALFASNPQGAGTGGFINNLKTKGKNLVNPLIDKYGGLVDGSLQTGSGEGSIIIQKGAVTITVQKGETIDEAKLVRMIEKALPDIANRVKIRQGK